MAQLLNEIQWGEPLLAPDIDPAWEAELKRRGGNVSEVDRRIAPSPWLREACLGITTGRACAIPAHLFNVAALVTSQENACRYCYGANRAYMKMLGYSESYIRRIEQRRAPGRAEREGARAGGVLPEPRALAAAAGARRARRARAPGLHAAGRPRNRALDRARLLLQPRLDPDRQPAEHGFERWVSAKQLVVRAHGPGDAHAGGAAPARRSPIRPRPRQVLRAGAFGPVLAPLAGLPGAWIMKAALDGAFASTVLSRGDQGADVRDRGAHPRVPAERSRGAHAAARPRASATPRSTKRWRRWARRACRRPRRGCCPGCATPCTSRPARSSSRRARSPLRSAPRAALEAIGVAALANATVRLAMLVE